MTAREKCISRHKVNTLVSSMCIVLLVESFSLVPEHLNACYVQSL